METEQSTQRRKKLPRNVWAVTITSFLTDVSTEMLVNLLPLFLFNVLGVRTILIGLIEGFAELTASLLKLVSGWLSDRFGRRKNLAVFGYGLSTLTKPFLYFTSSWIGVFFVRFLDRVGKGIRTAPRDALLADSVDEDTRGLAFGLHRAGDTAGAVIGLLLALGAVLLVQGNEQELTRDTFQKVVLLSLIPSALGVVVLAVGAKEVMFKERRSEPLRLSLRGLGLDFRHFLAIVVLFTLGNSSDAFLILRAQDTGLSVIEVMGMLITLNLVYSIVSLPAGVLSDRIGRRRVLIAGWLLFAFVYLGYTFAQSGWQMWLLMLPYGCYYGLTEGVARAFVADLVPQQRRGTAYGVYNAAIGLAALPASLIAGLLWQGVGPWEGFGAAAPFFYGATLALISVLLFLRRPLGDVERDFHSIEA